MHGDTGDDVQSAKHTWEGAQHGWSLGKCMWKPPLMAAPSIRMAGVDDDGTSRHWWECLKTRSLDSHSGWSLGQPLRNVTYDSHSVGFRIAFKTAPPPFDPPIILQNIHHRWMEMCVDWHTKHLPQLFIVVCCYYYSEWFLQCGIKTQIALIYSNIVNG